MTGYFEELRKQWRPVGGSLIGMSAGLAITPYVTATMAPFLIDDLGWSKADFAWVSVLGFASALSFPFGGRLCDIIGTRRTAMIGAIALPLIFLGFSMVSDLRTYIIFYLLQCTLSVTTTATIYCRIIVQYVHRSRGLALGLAASGPAILGMFGTPLLHAFVAQNGWRAGYQALTVGLVIAGVIAMLMLPPDVVAPRSQAHKPKRNVRRDLAILGRMRAFWIIMGSVFLCSVTNGMMMPQMSIILRENGINSELVAFLISAYALGTLLGRLLSGLAIDHFSPPIVSMIGFGLSSVGMLLLASPLDSHLLVASSVMLIGLSMGAESDVIAYQVMQHFGVSVYSTVFGMSSAIMSISAGVGAVLATLLYRSTNTYAPFLIVAGCLIALGSMLFLFLPRRPVIPDFEAAGAARGQTEVIGA